MYRSVKVATPLTAVTLVVPDREMPEGTPLAMARVTSELAVVMTLPRASTIFTVTLGVMAPFTGVELGCTANARPAGTPGFTVNEVEVAECRAPSVARIVYVPAVLKTR